MKFANKVDAQSFCIEVDRPDLIEQVDENYQPSEDETDTFIKRRKKLIKGLRNFRRSQDSKEMWRRNRPRIMQGIKQYHRSNQGKRFHRELGRFLATRNTDRTDRTGRTNDDESDESLSIYEAGAILKAISSAKTHVFINCEYYKDVTSEADFWIFVEYAVPLISSIESKVINEDIRGLDEEEVDLLVRLTEENQLMLSLVERYGKEKEEVQSVWESAMATARAKYGVNEETDTFYAKTLRQAKAMLQFEAPKDKPQKLPNLKTR